MSTNKNMAYEFNFDGLVGPTHNYAGLSVGNVASTSNSNLIAKPKEAAKQGLQKMKARIVRSESLTIWSKARRNSANGAPRRRYAASFRLYRH